MTPMPLRILFYSGSKKLTDKIKIGEDAIDAGKLVLSPTRTYLPLLKKIIDECKPGIHGIIHNTGGAHTKVKKFASPCRIVKDNLLPIPPLFQMIHEESGTPWQEMYEVFNCGTRLEIYTDESNAKKMLDIASDLNIDAQVIGRVDHSDNTEVVLNHGDDTFVY